MTWPVVGYGSGGGGPWTQVGSVIEANDLTAQFLVGDAVHTGQIETTATDVFITDPAGDEVSMGNGQLFLNDAAGDSINLQGGVVTLSPVTYGVQASGGIANGALSFAAGDSSSSEGYSSAAFGGASASGYNAFAAMNASAPGQNAAALSAGIANDLYDVAMAGGVAGSGGSSGFNFAVNDGSTASGGNAGALAGGTASGMQSIAIGFGSTASGLQSVVLGYGANDGGAAGATVLSDAQGDALSLSSGASLTSSDGDQVIAGGGFLQLISYGTINIGEGGPETITLNDENSNYFSMTSSGIQSIAYAGSYYQADSAGGYLDIASGNPTLGASGGETIALVSGVGISMTGDVGWFGATPVGQQVGGAATAGAVYAAVEQGMLNAAYHALQAYGFLT